MGHVDHLLSGQFAIESQVWIRAHEELSRLAKCRAWLEWEEGRGLVAASRAGVHRHLGFGSFFEYVEALFGYKPRSIEEKLRVAEALESLPLLSQDLGEGRLSWSAVRELTRVANAETEQAWREVARGKSARQIEELVSGRKSGDMPDSPVAPALKRHTLVFEVRAETMATFRDALAKLRRDAAGPLDEESALLLMARQVLGGPADEGRSSYQVAFTVCGQCGRGFQRGRREQFEVEPSVVRMALCDALCVAHSGDDKVAEDGAHVGEAGMLPSEVFAGACEVGKERVASTHAHVGEAGAIALADSTELRAGGAIAPDGAHMGEEKAILSTVPGAVRRNERQTPATVIARRVQSGANRGGSARRPRAKQAIPPSVRRFVMDRDHGRCVVPGCRHSVFVDVHHLELRSEGGDHAPDSLVVLCAAHHRAVHRGTLILEGTAGARLVVRHMDGTAYGDAVAPRAAAAQTRAFAALRGLGFREGEVRRALDRLRSGVDFDAEDSVQVVRAALRLLTPTLGAASG